MSQTAPVFLLDSAATLTFAVVEGTPSAASVIIYDENGSEVETPAVTVTGTDLTTPLAAGTLDAVAETYRARWTYTAGGLVYKVDQRFAVKRAIARHALSATRLTSAEYFPVLRSRYPSGVTTFQTTINAAFYEIANTFRAKGLDIDSMRDCSTLEPALANLAAYKIASNYSFGNDLTSQHQQWAQERLSDYLRLMEQALASFPWYDGNGDLMPSAGETQANLGRVRLSR